jgi:hypothetical protein
LVALAAVEMIPAALRELLASRDRDLLDQPDPDLDVAEAVEDALVAISERTDLPFEALLNTAPFVEAFGGEDYLRGLLAWRTADRAWARSRRRNKGPRPVPPAVPISA